MVSPAQFPAAWKPLREEPSIHIGPWVPDTDHERVYFCQWCNARWFVGFDRRDGYYWAQRLPPRAEVALCQGEDTGALVDLLPDANLRELAILGAGALSKHRACGRCRTLAGLT